jgi:hypothetical protein
VKRKDSTGTARSLRTDQGDREEHSMEDISVEGKCRLDLKREADVGPTVSAQCQNSNTGREGALVMAIYCLFHSRSLRTGVLVF